LQKKRENGQYLGKPPIGYIVDKDTKMLVANSYERKAVGAARCWRRGDLTFKEVTNKLNDSPVFSIFRGKKWKVDTVRKMIGKKHDWE
jgi:hypothetical protein